jgi:hypothetical protein
LEATFEAQAGVPSVNLWDSRLITSDFNFDGVLVQRRQDHFAYAGPDKIERPEELSIMPLPRAGGSSLGTLTSNLPYRSIHTDVGLELLLHVVERRSSDAGPKIDVAITRLVPGATASAKPLGATPRVLFVIGQTLTDPTIRPGAEIMSLLQQSKFDHRLNPAYLGERQSGQDRAQRPGVRAGNRALHLPRNDRCNESWHADPAAGPGVRHG